MEALLSLAIVSLLAALATYSVRKYLAVARSTEATQVVGAIARAVAMSSNRLHAEGRGIVLCGDAVTVPLSFAPVRNRAYQPSTSPGRDYQTGDSTAGWVCLGYENNSLHHYQYRYRLGGAPIEIPGHTRFAGIPEGDRWCAYARGDLDADDKFAWILLDGHVKDGNVVPASAVVSLDPEE